jgi:hypothetical protein
MRLGDLLSKPSNFDYKQVEAFLSKKRGDPGQHAKLDVGNIMLNYYCARCEDSRTFSSRGTIHCVFISKQLISLDCVLACSCGSNLPVWFLVESENDICGISPNVRVLKRSEKLSENVKINDKYLGSFTPLLEMAECSFRENLGAGATVYLRKAFEKVTIETADAIGIEYEKFKEGNPRNFSKLLKEVDKQRHIIPREFSDNGYKLFKELSSVVHGNYDEKVGLSKFKLFQRLVIGILENVRNIEEFQDIVCKLGWDE